VRDGSSETWKVLLQEGGRAGHPVGGAGRRLGVGSGLRFWNMSREFFLNFLLVDAIYKRKSFIFLRRTLEQRLTKKAFNTVNTFAHHYRAYHESGNRSASASNFHQG
jgi:hypothetical protein